MKISITAFGGEARAPNPKLLSETVGTLSLNQKPGRGDLRPWRLPLAVATVPAGRQTIYRMGRDVASSALYWLSWNTVVHAIHGFISGDSTERTYYTGDGSPKQTNNVLALASAPYPTASRELGVPVPVSQLVVPVLSAGASTITEIRYYTWTYVTDLGEESSPGPVSNQVSCKTDATLTVNIQSSPPSGSYGINRIRIYRTQSGVTGDAEFFFLREITSSTTTTTDDGRALGEVMPTNGWLSPPATLRNLTAMWNGMAAGINTLDGAVRYCVVYKPYAWPVAYETLPPNAKAVALATFGQRLLVLTTGRPVLVSGSSPESLDEQPLEVNQACIAPRSAVGMGHGVVWACPDGLAYVGEGGARLLTAGLMTRDDWQAINPSTLVAGVYEGAYFASYVLDGVTKGFLIDPLNPTGMYFLDAGYGCMFVDESQDALFVLDGPDIRKWDAGVASMTAKYRSKVFVTPPANFGAARVEADAYPVTVAFESLEMKASAVAALVAARPGVFTAPTLTSLRYTATVTSDRPFRLPGGFESRNTRVQIDTSNAVQLVVMSTGMGELGGN